MLILTSYPILSSHLIPAGVRVRGAGGMGLCRRGLRRRRCRKSRPTRSPALSFFGPCVPPPRSLYLIFSSLSTHSLFLSSLREKISSNHNHARCESWISHLGCTAGARARAQNSTIEPPPSHLLLP